jgi:hypothetical protein
VCDLEGIGEDQLQVYIRVQQVSNDTDRLMWWKQHCPPTTPHSQGFLVVCTDGRGVLVRTVVCFLGIGMR